MAKENNLKNFIENELKDSQIKEAYEKAQEESFKEVLKEQK